MATRLIVLILLFAPGLARADKRQRARELFAAGKAHYAAKHYEQAIAAFRKAASVWPSPVLDFNIARSYDHLGRPQNAISHYRRYLQKRPRATNKGWVIARIAALRKQHRRVPRDPYEDLEHGPGLDGHDDNAPEVPAVTPLPTDGPATTPNAGGPPARVAQPPAPVVVVPNVAGSGTSARPRAAAPQRHPRRLASSARIGEMKGRSGPAEPATPPNRPPRRGQDRPPRDDIPVYKKWWFWVSIAAAAGIAAFVISTASSGRGNAQTSSSRGGLTINF